MTQQPLARSGCLSSQPAGRSLVDTTALTGYTGTQSITHGDG